MGPLNAVLGRGGGGGGGERATSAVVGRPRGWCTTGSPKPDPHPPTAACATIWESSGKERKRFGVASTFLVLFFSNHHVVSGPRFEETVPCVPSFLLPRGFREPKIASNIAQKTPTWLKIAHIMPCL